MLLLPRRLQAASLNTPSPILYVAAVGGCLLVVTVGGQGGGSSGESAVGLEAASGAREIFIFVV